MKSTETKRRIDGRRALLVYLKPELIRDLKRRALDEDVHVYELVEAMLKDLMTNDATRPASGRG